MRRRRTGSTRSFAWSTTRARRCEVSASIRCCTPSRMRTSTGSESTRASHGPRRRWRGPRPGRHSSAYRRARPRSTRRRRWHSKASMWTSPTRATTFVLRPSALGGCRSSCQRPGTTFWGSRHAGRRPMACTRWRHSAWMGSPWAQCRFAGRSGTRTPCSRMPKQERTSWRSPSSMTAATLRMRTATCTCGRCSCRGPRAAASMSS